MQNEDVYTEVRKLAVKVAGDKKDHFGRPAIDRWIDVSNTEGLDPVAVLIAMAVNETSLELSDFAHLMPMLEERQYELLNNLVRKSGESYDDYIRYIAGYTRRTADTNPLKTILADLKWAMDLSTCVRLSKDTLNFLFTLHQTYQSLVKVYEMYEGFDE